MRIWPISDGMVGEFPRDLPVELHDHGHNRRIFYQIHASYPRRISHGQHIYELRRVISKLTLRHFVNHRKPPTPQQLKN